MRSDDSEVNHLSLFNCNVEERMWNESTNLTKQMRNETTIDHLQLRTLQILGV